MSAAEAAACEAVSKSVSLADMLDADGVLVRAHAMIRTVAIAYHLVNVAVSINDVMRRNLPAICFLKFRQSAGKRPFSAVQHNLVDACAVTARAMSGF